MNLKNVKEKLLEGLSEERRRFAETLIENTAKVVESKGMVTEAAEDGGPSAVHLANNDVAKYAKVAFPVIRRTTEALIAIDLINAQPMPGPVARVRYIDFDYRQDVAAGPAGWDAVAAGDDAIETLHHHYSRAAYGDADFNAVAAMDPGAQTVHLEHDPGKRMGVKLSFMTLEAGARKLHAHWSPEAEDDASNMYGVSLESELVALLTNEIQREMDREVLNFIEAQGAASTFDFTTSSGRYHEERFSSISININQLSTDIARDTKQGGASWIVVSPNVLTALTHMKSGAFKPAPLNVGQTAFVGTLGGNIKVYLDIRATSDKILVGRRGESSLEAGIILGTYLPVEMARAQSADTFDHVVGLRTRYALGATKYAPKYYRVLTITNLSLV